MPLTPYSKKISSAAKRDRSLDYRGNLLAIESSSFSSSIAKISFLLMYVRDYTFVDRSIVWRFRVLTEIIIYEIFDVYLVIYV